MKKNVEEVYLVFFKGLLLKVKIIQIVGEGDRGTERDLSCAGRYLLSMGSLPRWLQWPRLDKTETNSRKFI